MKNVIISDLHLGSELCRCVELRQFLSNLEADRLILNGDVFDSHDFRRLHKNHWGVLSDLRKLSKHMEIIWLAGNHDGPVESLAHLIGVDVKLEYIFYSGGKRFLLLHGDRFDDFITNHPILTWIADLLYLWTQRFNQKLAIRLKRSSKTFLRCAEKVRNDALRHAKKRKCDVVCCGHTHHAVTSEGYHNSGSWTETPCTFLVVEDGEVFLHELS